MTDIRRTVVRARDLFVAQLRFHQLDFDPSGTRLIPSGAGDPLIVLELPPQHTVEQTFNLKALPSDEMPAAASRLAGWSRVVFRLPATVTSVPLELAPILELLESCELQVVDAALPRSADPQPPGCLTFGLFTPGGPALRAPTPQETAVELPFRLLLSPPGSAGFVHRTLPVAAARGRTELWHSLLGVAPGWLGALDAADRSVRAVWLRTGDSGQKWDPEHPVPPIPIPPDKMFGRPLDHERRHQIVHLSANFNARRLRPSVALDPRAIAVKRLALTSLGATLDLRGEWTPPPGMSIEEWAYRAAVGRDHFVRIVEAGWLLPFGHRASFVEIFERRFDDNRPARPALEWGRTFVAVREPLREYAPATAPNHRAGRAMPLRWVHIRTLMTPELLPASGKAFPIRLLNGEAFEFDLQGGDAGVDRPNLVDFRCPMWFVAQDAVKADVDAAVNGFGEHPVPLAGDPAVGGRGIPLDIVAAAKQPGDDSTWRAHTITWTAVAVTPRAGPEMHPAPFHPQAASIGLRIPAVEVVAAAPADRTITFHERYLEHGLDAGQNPGALIATLPKLPLTFQGKGDRAGGLIRPELGITGLSLRLGPVAGPKLDDIASGAFNPSDFFGDVAPKLFGVLELDRLLKATGLLDGAIARAPKLLADPLGPAKFEWEPRLRDYPEAPKAIFVTSPESHLKVIIDAHTPAAPEISCTLEHFRIRLVPDFEAVELHFAKAAFMMRSAKPDVVIELAERVKFIGALSFVETLTEVIPIDAFSDPPNLDVTPSGAVAGLSLTLPSLTLGMFSLENVSLGAAVLVPFDERALAVSFNFCRRHEPFLLTVSALGGGGFFSIELDARGLHRLEAALEFGASLSMNLGVASGGVHVMAGIYFAYESDKGAVLTGYLRVGGNVSVLGLISISIELNLSLSYESASGKAVGRATLTIEIDIFLFSTSLEISCERKFAGSASDPSFEQVMSRYLPNEPGVGDKELDVRAGVWPWEEYCRAYA
jgi:hypothetical protein